MSVESRSQVAEVVVDRVQSVVGRQVESLVDVAYPHHSQRALFLLSRHLSSLKTTTTATRATTPSYDFLAIIIIIIM